MPAASTTTVAVVWALVSGSLYFAAFPPLDLGPLAWVALAPLLVAVAGRGNLASFALGWLAGTVACNGLTTPSLLEALPRTGLSFPASLGLAVLIPQLLGALPFAGFAVVAAALMRRWRGSPTVLALGVAAAWAATDLLRARFFGCPWVLLAHSQHAHLRLLQIAELAGAPGVGFVLALPSAPLALAVLMLRPERRGAAADGAGLATPLVAGRQRRAGSVVVVVACLSAAAVYGEIRLGSLREAAATGAALRVAIVQPSIPAEWRTSLRHARDALLRLRELTARVAESPTRLIVWPENAIGVAVGSGARVRSTVGPLLAKSGAALLLGAPHERTVRADRATIYNSAHLLDESGQEADRYDKRILVPFGEFSPAAQLGERLGFEQAPGTYAAGSAWTLFSVAGYRFATLICFESIFADAVRRFVAEGAEFLVNISNDDWFGGESARQQHFHATLLRAIETRRPLLRATNSGVSAIVAPTGELLARAREDAPATLEATIVPAGETTVYVRFGDLFGWACSALVLLLLMGSAPPR